MIPRSDFRAAEIVKHFTKLVQLLSPAFSDADCRKRINQAIDTIREIDDAGHSESLHRLFLAALTFTPDTDTATALKELDQVMPNPMNWNKMLDTFTHFIEALLNLFHPADPPPAVAITIDLRSVTTNLVREKVSPDLVAKQAAPLADVLDNLANLTLDATTNDPVALRHTAGDHLRATAAPHGVAWLNFFLAIEADMERRATQGQLSTVAQQQEALTAIARGLRDLLSEKTNPLHAPDLPPPPRPAA